MIGKWHLGHHSPFLPTENGFASYFGLLYSNDMRPPRTEVPLRLYRDDQPIEGEVDQGLLTERYTEEALRVHPRGGRPAVLPLPRLHHAAHAGARLAALRRQVASAASTATRSRRSTGASARSCARCASGARREHAGALHQRQRPGDEPRSGGGSAGLLRGGKGSSYEGGMREPCIVRWPGRIAPAQVRADVAGTLDLFPTLARARGRGAEARARARRRQPRPAPRRQDDGERSAALLLEGRLPRGHARGQMEVPRDGTRRKRARLR